MHLPEHKYKKNGLFHSEYRWILYKMVKLTCDQLLSWSSSRVYAILGDFEKLPEDTIDYLAERAKLYAATNGLSFPPDDPKKGIGYLPEIDTEWVNDARSIFELCIIAENNWWRHVIAYCAAQGIISIHEKEPKLVITVRDKSKTPTKFVVR